MTQWLKLLRNHLKKRAEVGAHPLAILICGRAHSDHGRGTVARIKSRMPSINIVVLSAETVEDLSASIYKSPRDTADYVIVAQAPVGKSMAMPKATKRSNADESLAEDSVADDLPTENPEGLRPALGFMPDYAGEDVKGVGVGPVREGGPAEKAGIKEGDVIVSLRGIPTPDIEMYSEVLDEQFIGRTVTVRVRKGDAEVDLQVKIGSRPGR